jgi:hypothetical protein
MGALAAVPIEVRRFAATEREETCVSARDLAVLGWVSEQYAARLDHLTALIGLGERTARRTITRLRDAGLVEHRAMIAGQSGWVWLTPRGQRVVGDGFRCWRPRLGLLEHIAAVNSVRLHIAARSPESEWVCERVLARDRQTPSEHVPDGVVLTAGQAHAVEVELTVKSMRRVEAILDGFAARFDTTVYFCAAGPRAQLERLSTGRRWPSLVLRDLPGRER